ncbi:M50 family metallopeptidase [Patescibacteria group bacterium]|nr:M50 family metallopeptidase [Patescibacteria group bacterium]
MKRSVSILVAVITAILNWYAFAQIGHWLKLQDPNFFATVILATVVVHELGHLIFLEANGIKTHLIFLVIMGGAVPDASCKNKLDNLPWSKKAAIYLAGVSGNLIVVIVFAILAAAGNITITQLEGVVNISGNLILYNLLPLWIFDGGHFAKVLFNSISEDRDGYFVWAIGITFFIMTILMAILSAQVFFMTAIWLFWGLQFQAKHDDPEGSYNKLAMTKNQQRNWGIYYAFLLILGLVFMSTTRVWLKTF